MVERKTDLLFWGYIANALQSMLEPYKSGSSVVLTPEDKEIIEQSKKFMDAIIKGFDTVNSPSSLSFSYRHSEIPSATALSLALEIFSAMRIAIPDNLEGFRKKLTSYRDILEKMKKWQPLSTDDSKVAEEVTSFFNGLSNKVDQERYEAAYSL